MSNNPMTLSKQEEMLAKELDVLESAISDENHALAICSREEIWKIVYRMIDLALAERDREVVEKRDAIWNILCGMNTNIKSEKEYADEIINLITNK